MSAEARLLTLAEAYRAEHGEVALANEVQFAMALGAQAPELANEIRALAAAVQLGARGRIAASADAEGEAARIAGELATREKVPAEAARTAVQVARTMGASAAPLPAAPADNWAGETVAVQRAPPPAPPAPPAAAAPPPAPPAAPASPAAPPAAIGGVNLPPWVMENKWAIGIAALALVIFIWTGSRDGGGDPQRNGIQAQQGGGPGLQPQPGGGQAASQSDFPALGTGGELPTLRWRTQRRDRTLFGFVPFTLQTQSGPVQATVLSSGGWSPIQFSILDPRGSGQLVNVSHPNMQLTQGRSGPARVGQVQWQQDGLNLGPMCLAFEGGQVQGETAFFPGTTMCVYDASCQQAYGCGRIQ